MSKYYNEHIKERFLTENEFSEGQLIKYNLLFRKTKAEETSRNKDIYEMNQKECELIMSLLQSRSMQVVNMNITLLRRYIHWCNGQNLIPHRVNYFDDYRTSEDVSKFLSNQAINNQIISKEQLKGYTDELIEYDDYQGAMILNLLFLGVVLNHDDNNCELRNIKISDVDFEKNIITTSSRVVEMDDDLRRIVENAIEQESVIRLLNILNDEVSMRPDFTIYNTINFLIKGRKYDININDPVHYAVVAGKIREMSEFLYNPHINAMYLNLSGIIKYLNDRYTKEELIEVRGSRGTYVAYEDAIDKFKLKITRESLKGKLKIYLQ